MGADSGDDTLHLTLSMPLTKREDGTSLIFQVILHKMKRTCGEGCSMSCFRSTMVKNLPELGWSLPGFSEVLKHLFRTVLRSKYIAMEPNRSDGCENEENFHSEVVVG